MESGRANTYDRPTANARVRCLACGTVYVKPFTGGTAHENPGCPECGYVGWTRLDGPRGLRWARFREDTSTP
jgi:hypothetical protein